MKIGDVAVVNGDNRLLGVVTAIDDYDRATVKLDVSGVEVLVEMAKLRCVSGTCPKRNVQVGSVVMAPRDRRVMGEVLAIDDQGRATVKLSHSGLEILVNVSELRRFRWI